MMLARVKDSNAKIRIKTLGLLRNILKVGTAKIDNSITEVWTQNFWLLISW